MMDVHLFRVIRGIPSGRKEDIVCEYCLGPQHTVLNRVFGNSDIHCVLCRRGLDGKKKEKK